MRELRIIGDGPFAPGQRVHVRVDERRMGRRGLMVFADCPVLQAYDHETVVMVGGKPVQFQKHDGKNWMAAI